MLKLLSKLINLLMPTEKSIIDWENDVKSGKRDFLDLPK